MPNWASTRWRPRAASNSRECRRKSFGPCLMPTPSSTRQSPPKGCCAAKTAVEGRRIIDNYTGEYDWHTPSEYIEAARTVMGGIDLDPASSAIFQRTVRARTYYTRDHDSLSAAWRGRVWMNRPYAHDLIVRFIAKLCAHVTAREVTAAIMLTDNRTDTQWFQQAAGLAPRICFTEGRVRFLRPTGELGKPMNGSCIFYFGEALDTFTSVFGQFGLVYPEPLNLTRPRAGC
jgi:hypothetical protein